MTHTKAHAVAAKMLGVPGNDEGRLHYSLYDAIERASHLTQDADGQLASRQAIAVLIAIWEENNPGQEAWE